MTSGNPGDLGGQGAGRAARIAGAARHRPLRWTAALLAVLTVAGATACAGPPDKGEVRGAALNQSRNNVVILAREPTNHMNPQTLVTDFLQALTGDQEDPTFSVAQEFLTPAARGKWIPAGSTWDTTTKIVNSPQVQVAPEHSAERDAHPAAESAAPAAAPQPTEGSTQTVIVTGSGVAQVDPFGFYQLESQPNTVTQEFTVKYLGAGTGWRIDTPPPFRIIDAAAFKRAYQAYQAPLPVYLPTHSLATQMDQVYLTQATGKVDYTYDALTRAVLHGRLPSQNSKLQLQSPVTVDAAGVARVALKTAPSGALSLSDVQRALSLTFRDASQTQQLLAPTQLSQILLTYPGCGGACTSTAILPEPPQPPTVYWACPQGQNLTETAIVSRQLPAGNGAGVICPTNGAKPLTGLLTSGLHLEKNSPIAVKQTPDSANVKSPAATTVVAALQDSGQVVVFNDKNSDRTVWYTAPDPGKVTDLEWDPVDGSLWVVDDYQLYRVQDSGGKDSGQGTDDISRESVVVPGGQLTRFKLSPDGLRAVVVSGQKSSDPSVAGSALPAAMVTVDRAVGGLTTLATNTVFPLLAGPGQSGDQQTPSLQSVTDASWADGRTVVLLGIDNNASTPKLYKVYLDGSQDSAILDPEDAQPGTGHVTAVLGGSVGHPSLWTFSDAPAPSTSNITDSYFKRIGGLDSIQEVGWSPVVATVTAG